MISYGSINPERDSLPKLIQRLEEYAKRYVRHKGMKVVLNLPAKNTRWIYQ